MDIYPAERIEKKRVRLGKIQYLVKWSGCSSNENTWEPEENIINKLLIKDFEHSSRNQPPKKRGRKSKSSKRSVQMKVSMLGSESGESTSASAERTSELDFHFHSNSGEESAEESREVEQEESRNQLTQLGQLNDRNDSATACG